MITQEEIYREITEERQAQDRDHGTDGHVYSDWILLVGKQFGKLCATDLDMYEDFPRSEGRGYSIARADYRDRLVKIAALCVAALEDFNS